MGRSLFAQMVDNERGFVWTDIPFFNPSFIKEQKIQSIVGRYSFKNPGERMYESDASRGYFFDEEGRLIKTFDTRPQPGFYDTIFQYYRYNNRNQLIYYSEGNKKIYTYTLYQYNDSGQLVESECYNQVVMLDGDYESVLKKKESYRYQVEGQDTTRITRNSYDIPFLTTKTYYNQEGQVYQIDERFITNGQGSSEYYSYDERGDLISKAFQKTRNPQIHLRFTFQYDDNGNVLEKKVYTPAEIAREVQFVYNDESGRLTAILEQENDNNKILILRLSLYHFYGETND